MTALLAALLLQTGLRADAPRLDAPVQADLTARPLAEALPALSNGAVELKVARHMQDWKLDAYGGEMPLRRWLRAVADAFEGQWEPTPDGYRLVQAPATRRREEAVAGREEQLRREQVQRITDLARRFATVPPELIPGEVERLRREGRTPEADLLVIESFVGDPNWWTAGVLLAIPPAALKGVWEGEPWSAVYSYDGPPPASEGSPRTQNGNPGALRPSYDPAMAELATGTGPVLMAVIRDPETRGLSAFYVRQPVCFGFPIPYEPDGVPPVSEPPEAPWGSGDPLPASPTRMGDPGPQSPPSGPARSRWLWTLAHRYGLPVVSASTHGRFDAKPGGDELSAEVAAAKDARFSYRDGVLLCRPRRYVLERGWEPSAAAVDRFESAPLTLDSLADFAAALPPDAQHPKFVSRFAFRHSILGLGNEYAGFTLWSALDDRARAELREGKALPASRLDAKGRRSFRRAVLLRQARYTFAGADRTAPWIPLFQRGDLTGLKLWAREVRPNALVLVLGFDKKARVEYLLSIE